MDNFCSGGVAILINAIKGIITLIQWIIPIILIVMGTIDMVKAVSSGDDKETKEVQKKFGRRLIYAVVIFLIPIIIEVVFSLASNLIKTGDDDSDPNTTFEKFIECWDNVEEKIDKNAK